MEWNVIKAELQTLRRGYPVEASQAILADPVLIDRTVEELTRLAGQPDELEESMFHLHAMNLLAQLRDPRAFRPLLKIGALPSDRMDAVLGDHLTESFDCCVASVCDDEALIRDFVKNRGHDKWARYVMVDALVKRVLEGDQQPEVLIGWLTDLGGRTAAWLKTASGEDPDFEAESLLMDAFAGALADIGGAAELETIRRWWDADLLDPQVAGIDWYQKEVATPWEERVETLRRHGRGYVRDAIGSMRKWYCFSDDFHDRELRRLQSSERVLHDVQQEGTYVRENAKVGRNDPCPCGSGRKFKKCCGA